MDQKSFKCEDNTEKFNYVCFFIPGGLVGPAISSIILHDGNQGIAVYNSSYAVTLWSKCGARDCPGIPLNETAIEPQDTHKVNPVNSETILLLTRQVSNIRRTFEGN